MDNFLLTVMLFILPLLVGGKRIPNKGLNLGLWISLFFWGSIHYSLSIIVFSSAFIFFIYTLKDNFQNVQTPYIKKPSFQSFLIFLTVLTIFCAIGDSCSRYGEIIQLENNILQLSALTGFIGLVSGSIIFGMLSDRKGPFPSTIILTLLASASVGLTALGHDTPFLFPLGIFFLYSAVSGAFTLMPLMTMTYFGNEQLIYVYPTILLTLSSVWGISRYIYLENWRTTSTPETYLFTMIFLAMFAAVFAFNAWKKRLVLVK